MFSFIASLFGCAHTRCTFPMTATNRRYRSEGKSFATAYVVCLDCGQEFRYDWERMKMVGTVEEVYQAIA